MHEAINEKKNLYESICIHIWIDIVCCICGWSFVSTNKWNNKIYEYIWNVEVNRGESKAYDLWCPYASLYLFSVSSKYVVCVKQGIYFLLTKS